MCSPTVSVAAVADCSRHVWTNQSTRKRLGSTSPAWGQPGFTEVKLTRAMMTHYDSKAEIRLQAAESELANSRRLGSNFPVLV